jgi:hypothetical protein
MYSRESRVDQDFLYRKFLPLKKNKNELSKNESDLPVFRSPHVA